MTPPAGPEEVREPDFEAARDRAIGNIQFYGDPKNRPLTANEMRCLNDARAYLALQAQVRELREMVEVRLALPTTKVIDGYLARAETAESRLAKLEQERGRGEG